MSAFLLSTIFLMLSLMFASLANGFLTAFFLILSLIAFLNSGGGPFNDDDDKQRPA